MSTIVPMRSADPSGAVILGVEVKLIRQETCFIRTTPTDLLGNYEFRIVDPGLRHREFVM